MKKLAQTAMLLMALMVVFTGCDAAKQAADAAKDKAGDMAGDMAGLADMDLGGFDMAGMKEKFTGITDGFKDVSAENVDGLTSKISGLSDSMDTMGLDKLPEAAKGPIGGMISKFGETVTSAMGGISDEGILGKLKPVVDGLMEKINAFK